MGSFFRFFLLCYISIVLQACASSLSSPEIVKINLISVNKTTVQDVIMDGEFSEEFDVPGFKIVFESDREIVPNENVSEAHNFIWLNYYDCDSSLRPETDSVFSSLDYVKLYQSWAKKIDSKPNGPFIYQTQFIEEYSNNIQNICAKIFVHDGNIQEKTWKPLFVSNEMKLELNKDK